MDTKNKEFRYDPKEVIITYLETEEEQQDSSSYTLSDSAVLFDGEDSWPVVGENFYEGNLLKILERNSPNQRRATAELKPVSDNEHDPNAIEVYIDGLQVGYLSRENAMRGRKALVMWSECVKTILCGAYIKGGEKEKPNIHVYLDLPFVIPRPPKKSKTT